MSAHIVDSASCQVQHLLAVVLHPAAAAVPSPCSALQGPTAGLQWAVATALTAAPAQQDNHVSAKSASQQQQLLQQCMS
jgi:hypothetical protein